MNTSTIIIKGGCVGDPDPQRSSCTRNLQHQNKHKETKPIDHCFYTGRKQGEMTRERVV